MPSLAARLMKRLFRARIRRDGLDQAQLVAHLRQVFNHTPVPTLLPRDVRVTQLQCADFHGEKVTVASPEVTILYLHGGAYMAGVTRTYHNLAGRLAKRLQAEVFLPTYPLAPENPFPRACERVLEAYRFLLREGRKPESIIIAGDSAGGGLTLATLLAIKDNDLPRPAGAVTFSPGTRAHEPGASAQANDATDCMLSADMIRQAVNIYVPDPGQRHHPYASPCLGDYTGMPPVMITVASDECLYDDARSVRDALEASGVEVTWIERTGLFHVWPVMVPFLPEAQQELKNIEHFIRRCTGKLTARSAALEFSR